MTKQEILLLTDYDKWADFKIIEISTGLTDEQFKKDLKSSFGGIQGVLVHILSANFVWLARWKGQIPSPLNVENYPSVEALKKQYSTYHNETENFLKNCSDDILNKQLQYTDFKGNMHDQPLYQQIQHKVNHSTYHRGQVVAMLRQLEMPVVSTDLINYIRQKEKNG